MGLWSLVLGPWSLVPGPSSPAGAAALPEDWQAYRSAQERAREVEKADPRAAIDAWYAIFKERPKLDAWVGVLACSELVRLHYERVKDAKTALELCDWALKQYAGSPALARTAADKASVLLREGRPEDAEAAVAAHWDLVTRSYYAYSDAAVRQRFLALEGQGKAAEAEELLARALKEIPQLLDEAQQNPKGWIYNRLVYSLTARKRADEAASWAKARFVTCRYDPAAMERSGRALVRLRGPVTSDQGPGTGGARATPVPGHWSLVPGPALDEKSVAEILTRVQGGAQPTHDRISLHLLVGNVREAFLEARRLLVDNPDQPGGTLELCRVLKALELSSARANALVAFLKEGTGVDPLPEALRPLGITPEALPAEVRAGQRTAMAHTPLVPGDALAEKLDQGAPLPETVAPVGLPAALPVPVPADPAALPQTAPAPAAAGGAVLPPAAIPMPMPAKVEVALPAAVTPAATAPAKVSTTGVAGIEGVGPAPVATMPAPVVAGTEGLRPATEMVPIPLHTVPTAAVPVGGLETPAPVTPTVAATPAIVSPDPVSEGLAAVTMALTRLQAGEIAPEAAWEEGKLTADDIIRALEALPVYGHDVYANALTTLLIAHAPDRVKDAKALPANLRVSLARYYGHRRDAQCVPLWNGLLRHPATDAYVELASAGLCAYYQLRGEYLQAAAACVEGEARARNPAVQANCLVSAARMYMRAGDERKAEETYAKVAAYGYAWATANVTADHASGLMGKGQYQEARALLEKHPVTGMMRVAYCYLLGVCCFRTAELDQAEKYLREAQGIYERLGRPSSEGMPMTMHMVGTYLKWIREWRPAPLTCWPTAVRVSVAAGESKRGSRITLRSFAAIPVAIEIEGVRVDARLDGQWRRAEHRDWYERDVVVDCPPEVLAESGQATLVLTTPRLPEFSLRIPVRIRVHTVTAPGA